MVELGVVTPLPLPCLLAPPRPPPLVPPLPPILLVRPTISPRSRRTVNASPSVPKDPKQCIQPMNGIERLPSLLGSFRISECIFIDILVLLLCLFWVHLIPRWLDLLLFATFFVGFGLSLLWLWLVFVCLSVLASCLSILFYCHRFLSLPSFTDPLLPTCLFPFAYRDLLELKEIQRSLPHANQPPDVVTGRPGKQFLSGVPIVLLPLLGSGGSPSGGDGGRAHESEAKKLPSPGYFSAAHERTSGNVSGWGPPSLTGFGRQAQQSQSAHTQAQATPVRPPFPFPPRPVPFSAPASTHTFTSARAPVPPSPITRPWSMNSQSQNKTGSSPTSPPFPSSPTSPYPALYANRPSSTSTSTTYVPQQQTQSRTAWAPPPSLSHLMPARPIKLREKPKFEFITLLDNGAGSGGSSTPSATVTPGGTNGVGNVETTTTKVGPEVLHIPISKLPSGLVGIEGKLENNRRHHHHDEHDLDDHDLVSVNSCPSLCASCCPSSCSASEVDTDHEHEPEIDTEGRYYSPKGYSGLNRYGYAVANGWGDESENGALRSTFTTTSPLDLDVGLLLDNEVKRDKTMVVMKKKPEPKKEKKNKKKFILVNDMEMELDDSETESDCEEEDSAPLSARITNTSASRTRETTTTTTTKTTTTEKTTTTTTRTTTSPQSNVAPVPVRSALWGSHHPHPPSSSSASASLITPPTTPPSEQVARYGGHATIHSPTSSPSSASRGRVKAIQKKGQVVGNSTSRERSGSMGSDTSGYGSPSPTSPSRSSTVMKMGSPLKLKSKTS